MFNLSNWNNFKVKYAFTLAEVLIVLGVIGIIAEMTIPTLMNNVQDAQMKAGVKTAYTILSQASLMAANDNSGTLTNLWASSYDNVALKNVMIPYLKVIKDCGGTTGAASSNSPVTNGCWFANTAMDKTAITEFNNYAGVILANGMAVDFRAHDPACTANDNSCGWAMVDVNGSKPPNTIGKDAFYYYFKASGAVGSGGDSTCSPTICATCTGAETGNYSGWGCTYNYLYK